MVHNHLNPRHAAPANENTAVQGASVQRSAAPPAFQLKASGEEETEMAPIQQMPVIQCAEMPQNTDVSTLGPGDWLVYDRVNNTQRWQDACLHNLQTNNARQYTQPHERRDFYLWFYNHVSAMGHEVRWPIAAYVVAGGAAKLSYGSPFGNALQIAVRQGNQVIFDDVLPKLRDLAAGPVLTGAEAQSWDAQTLSDEQALVQAMYGQMQDGTVEEFRGFATQDNLMAQAGGLIGLDRPHRDGQWHNRSAQPAFSGDLMSVDDRWSYGMDLADQYSSHPTGGARPDRPAAGADYQDGTNFNNLNDRMGLHRLDAELDDFNVDEDRVVEIMQTLTREEQQDLGLNRQRLTFMANALDEDEMNRALRGRNWIPTSTQRWLLDNL
jgi:hypothetical protein